MGLQNQLSDVSSESILVVMVVLVGKSVSYLHSVILGILHNLGLAFRPNEEARNRQQANQSFEGSLYDAVASGLAGLVVLCEQLSLNRDRSYPYQPESADDLNTGCVVCLNRLGAGDHVRRLACRHVFHRDCLEGWLDHLNFSCPLCRAPLGTDERVDQTRRRVAGDLLAWFPPSDPCRYCYDGA